jgi:hypothetical protein
LFPIYDALAKSNPDAYLPDFATALNNLGVLYHHVEQSAKAETGFGKPLRSAGGFLRASRRPICRISQ